MSLYFILCPMFQCVFTWINSKPIDLDASAGADATLRPKMSLRRQSSYQTFGSPQVW